MHPRTLGAFTFACLGTMLTGASISCSGGTSAHFGNGGGGQSATGASGGTPSTGGVGGSAIGGSNGCAADQMECSGRCVSVANDPSHCGNCTTFCTSAEQCIGGACVCRSGLTACGTACVSLASDARHCGSCATACASGQVCSNSACVLGCASGQTLCGQSCVVTATDDANCGTCGTACSAGQSCTNGSCQCPLGQTLCGSSCLDTSSDSTNCGGCNVVCGSGQTCLAGTCVSSNCATPPAASVLVGWATQNGGTTGGGTAAPVVVTTAAQFTANVATTAARVVYLTGSISGSFAIGSNKTIVGVCGAQIHGHLGLDGSSNVIVRNLKIVGNNCTDSPTDCSAGADAVTVNGGAHNLWFDHLDVSDGSDGNLDITQGSDFVTVSWTKFSYSSQRTDPIAGSSGHRFSNLIGASDTDTRDPGHLNVTWHHDWWADNVYERMPRTRRGKIHVFDNLYTAAGDLYCTNAGYQATLLVENNVYTGVDQPLDIGTGGDMKATGNLFTSTSGNKTANGTGFTPPYAYSLDSTSGLEATLRAQVGPH